MSILPNGVYLIINDGRFASNFPGGIIPSAISFGQKSGFFSEWILKHVGEGAYSITNLETGFKAFVEKEEEGASVDGNPAKGVNFAIERAGGVDHVIKSVNRDLDWTVKEDQYQPGFFRTYLSASGKGVSQHFILQFIRPGEH